tara:strand:- start:196 stop:375 length:180 start_codon:yes stop_codon:yes gene_type:complete
VVAVVVLSTDLMLVVAVAQVVISLKKDKLFHLLRIQYKLEQVANLVLKVLPQSLIRKLQ